MTEPTVRSSGSARASEHPLISPRLFLISHLFFSLSSIWEQKATLTFPGRSLIHMVRWKEFWGPVSLKIYLIHGETIFAYWCVSIWVSTSSFLTHTNFYSCKQVALKQANPFATGCELVTLATLKPSSWKSWIIPLICHFFTLAKILENIHTEKRQFFALNL